MPLLYLFFTSILFPYGKSICRNDRNTVHLQAALFLPLRANWKRNTPTHTATEREREASGSVGGPLLKRCLRERDLSASVILPLRKPPDLPPAVLLDISLFVLWITDVFRNSGFDTRPAQRSGNAIAKFFIYRSKRKKTVRVWQRWKERSACGLASGLSFLLGVPWCWVQSSQLGEECVCACLVMAQKATGHYRAPPREQTERKSVAHMHFHTMFIVMSG